MKAFLHALVHKLGEKVVCGIVLTNKTKHRLRNPEIKLTGGKIFLDPTMDSIDEDDVCMMVNYSFTLLILSFPFFSLCVVVLGFP